MINKKLLKTINRRGVGEFVADTDHNTLLNRDKAEQHPISAITDLQTTLDAKQAKLTAGTGIDITGDTISSTTVVSPDTALTSKTNTFEFRQVIKSGGSGLLDLQNSTGSVLNTTYDLVSTSVKLTSPNTTSMTFTAKDFNFSDKEIKNVGTPITNKSAANKEYVDSSLLPKADKTEITALDTKLTLNTNDISDNTAGILLKADKTELVNKQDKLTAGTNISIVGDVISSTGGAAGVTLDTAQTITGVKTFTNGINNNFIEVDGKSLIIKNSKTASSYLEVESVYAGTGYKNWFGIQLFRTTGTSRPRLANLEIRQDDSLYIDSVNDLSIQGANIKFNNVRLQQVGAPTADYDATTKKYVDDAVAAALRPYKKFIEKLMKEKNYDK